MISRFARLDGISFGSVKRTPIFDTSAIIDLSKRDSSDSTLKRLRGLLPRRGCPLSYVTVLELINGVCRSDRDRVSESLKPIILVSRLSRRKVLWSPISFVQKELFGLEDSLHQKSSNDLHIWLGRLIGPKFKHAFVAGGVEGTNLGRIKSLADIVEQSHCSYLVHFLNHVHPSWQSERGRSGSSLAENERETLKRTYPVEKWKSDCAEFFLEALKIAQTQEIIKLVQETCDAYFTFTVNLIRDSLVSNYRFEDNPNDFHDGIQLLYLSRPSYCLVTEDTHLIKRVATSSQRDRILTLDEFISAHA